MSAGKLYTPAQQSFKTRTIVAVAGFTGQELEFPAFEFGTTNKSEDFLAKFPGGKIPALEAASGLNLSEANAIAYYLAALAPNSGLFPTDVEVQAKINQWINFGQTEIYEKISLANGMFNNYVPFVKPVFQNRIEKTEVALAVLDKYLASNTFLVGDRITLADISVGATLADAFSKFLGPVEQKKYANVVRYEQTIVNHPKLAAAFAGVSLAKEVATYTPPKKDAPAKAPKAEAAPKAPKAKAAKKDDDEEEEESHADAPAPKNPLELLPKPALNLIDVKVKYSNTDTKTEFIPWFFEQDLSGYSAHKIDFKYNDELTLPFMSANQIGGFFARLEASRKYLFASMVVCGKANDSIITGVIFGRGDSAQALLDCAPDWESYATAPLDFSKPEDKKFFEDSLTWEITVGDKAFADGKIFK